MLYGTTMPLAAVNFIRGLALLIQMLDVVLLQTGTINGIDLAAICCAHFLFAIPSVCGPSCDCDDGGEKALFGEWIRGEKFHGGVSRQGPIPSHAMKLYRIFGKSGQTNSVVKVRFA
jgi:hypothetical protein